MRYPESLQKEGTIGFAAPSFGASTEPYKSRFDQALVRLSQTGFRFEIGPNCYENAGTGISNTPEKCGRELTEIYCSSENDAVISVSGGELMCETLDYVDFERVKAAAPKWFMGFSDNTNFAFLLPTLCDTAAIYGPCATSFGMKPWHPAVKDALDLMMGKIHSVKNYAKWEIIGADRSEDPLAPYHCTQDFQPVLYAEDGSKTEQVRMSGRLIGGCLDCLANLSGTQYDHVQEFCERYKEDGMIWFLESCDLNTMSFRRALWQLKHTGWFRYVRGFLFGRPYLYDDACCGLEWEEAMLAPVREFKVPVIRNVDIGHLPPMMPLICGAKADITGKNDSLKIAFRME